ncbi:alpha-N-methyltransferase NTM1 [Xylaria bambusicola]|uniref:alpha-N-methyltransferase NTM1 n=1 Tax=Xylaria bambusicola TaxID=326684 RepID=UPI00200734D8|nr:alpha-N-methyltransferase NTM1 [Xylaria bambusicola]KAI0526261.1 alpha-N-methyltransferase NTM1 [Xylaria bambusicola]
MAPSKKTETPTDADGSSLTVTSDFRINADDSRHYWQGIDANDNGMLGGYGHVSRIDLRGSRSFLAKLGFGRKNGVKAIRRVLEGGAGIGRITCGLLLDLAETVDIVEPISKFTDALAGHDGVGRIFNMGLEEWRPNQAGEVSYDVIWNQWCLGHLTDIQLEEYLLRCKSTLSVGEDGKVTGVIVVKENITTGEDQFDEIDSSVTRTEETFRRIFEKTGLRVIKSELQHGLPSELFPVRMFALRPK